ncbi:A-kinase-interacting protein 1-like isoform X2 [Amphiura filiformis]|uniref:A-kinase-interacting protein 1-like isoform X2 n=1 Tax=Amphiura filiformis TaxID=82378 RepID=UPI003B21196E
MPAKHCEPWMACTLCRSGRQGIEVLQRAQRRQVEWPQQSQLENTQRGSHQDPATYTSIDDAFSTVLQYMSSTTRQCKRFYKTNPVSRQNRCDSQHCRRFHNPQYTEVQQKHPLQRTEDVHIMVAPGTYAVTAGEWGKAQEQTHVVHVNQGSTVELDFVL